MSKTYRYSEIFYSFQGEAELAGKPSVWLRFFGCNLECNGFGQTDPTNPATYVLPYQTFDVSSVKRLEDLPVWNTGCDSSYSWSAKYKGLVHDKTVEEICDIITDQMRHPSNPEGLFVHPVTNQDTQMCFTGGEPMMNQKAMIAIMREFQRRENSPRVVTVETNATKKLTPELQEFINEEFGNQEGGARWHWAMSPKLWTVAGEKDAVIDEVIYSYCVDTFSSAILKFVCSGSTENWAELDEHVDRIQRMFGHEGIYCPEIWVMPVGATKDAQEHSTVGDIAMEAMRRGYNVATRNHCYVFGNVIGK
jgi:6-pyruvoyltetrahydropterin 2'-reductase